MATWENEFTGPGTSARVWLVLQVDVVSQDIATNQTTLNWYVRGEERITNASPYNLNPGRSGSAGVNGEVWSTSTSTYDFRGTFATNYWASGTTVVTHDPDGSKIISVSASYNSNDSILGTASVSSTLALPTIPRATDPSVSPTSGNTGSTYTITHAPASSSFYHDVAYSVDGGYSYVDIQTNIVGTDTSTDWTPAHTLLPNSTSPVGGSAIIRLITRASSGGTIIGTEYVNLPLTVPSSVKPTVSSVSWSDSQVSSPDIPTLMGGSDRYVQRWSKLTPTVTAAGSGGSTISTIQVTLNGQTTSSGAPFANAVALSGAVPFSVVATDSRGRVNNAYSNTVAVTAYNFPNLPVPTITRTSDAGGTTPSPTGTYLRVTPNSSVSSLNFGGEKNLMEYQIRTRLTGGSWTTVVAWTNTGVVGTTWTADRVLSGYLSSAEYEVEVSIRDLFGKNGYDTGNTVKTVTVNVASEAVFMDWDGALGIGIGKYRSQGMLDVQGTIYQNNGKRVMATRDIEVPDVSGTDFNNLKDTGWYVGASMSNRPTTTDAWYHIQVQRLSNDWVLQTVSSIYDNASALDGGPAGTKWERRYSFGTSWSSWRIVGATKHVVPNLDYMPPAFDYPIGYSVFVEELNVEFKKIGGTWKQEGIARVWDKAAAVTAYGRNSGNFRHEGQRFYTEGTKLYYYWQYSGYTGWDYYPDGGVVASGEYAITGNPTSDGTRRWVYWTGGSYGVVNPGNAFAYDGATAFYINQAGRWAFDCQLSFNLSSSSWGNVRMFQNGSQVRMNGASCAAGAFSVNHLYQELVCAAGSYIQFQYHSGAAGDIRQYDEVVTSRLHLRYVGPT